MKKYEKMLYKSNEDRIIWGVLGGVGEYFNLDPLLFRVIFLIITIFTAVLPGVIAYILLAILIPEAPEEPKEPMH